MKRSDSLWLRGRAILIGTAIPTQTGADVAGTDETLFSRLLNDSRWETSQPARNHCLLKRVFGVDVETCHLCGGKMRIIAAIEEPAVIRKILEHLEPPTKPPTIYSAPGPPKAESDLNEDIQCFPDFDFA